MPRHVAHPTDQHVGTKLRLRRMKLRTPSAIGSCILLGFLKKENAAAEALVRRSKTRALPSLEAPSLPPTVAPTYDDGGTDVLAVKSGKYAS
jgi:hypothetical protein